MALIRHITLGALIYFGFAFAYPNGIGKAYQVMALSCIAGGALGFWLLSHLLDLGEGLLKVLLELAFLAAVFLVIGFTLPQKSGKPPLAQWSFSSRIASFLPKR